MTGNGAAEETEGAETILRIELVPKGAATEVRLTHSGFVTEKSLIGHKENWPLALKLLDETLGDQINVQGLGRLIPGGSFSGSALSVLNKLPALATDTGRLY